MKEKNLRTVKEYAQAMNIKPKWFEQLRQMIEFTYRSDDLDAIGADTEEWSKHECERWNHNRRITNRMVYKAFNVYSFVPQDFGIDETCD